MRDQGRPHRRRMLVTTAVLALMLIGSVTITAYAMNSRTVIIRDDDVTTTFTTTRSEANDILQAREISLDNDDYLDLSEFSADGDCIIRIYRAKEIWLDDDGNVQRLRAAGTVQRLLDLRGIALKERDTISCLRTDLLADGMRIVIARAFDIFVLDGDQTYPLVRTEGTVAQALEECALTLEGDDYVTPPPLTPLEPGLTIHVNRVTYRERRVETSLDYETVTRKSSSLDLGKTRIDQEGAKGRKETLYQDKYINGEKVESIKLQETILKHPVDQIRIVGTKVVKLQPGLTPISRLTAPSALRLDGNGMPTACKDVIVGTAKAYTGDPTTAVGVKPKPGYIAVNPAQIPYGSQLWIVSNDGRYVYGYAVAADTGGFVKKQSCTVDLYMENEAQCNQWGHRGVTIYVLDLPLIDF